MLLTSEGTSSAANIARQCFLYKHFEWEPKNTSTYSCSQCNFAFHVDCFSIFHNHYEFKNSDPDLFKRIDDIKKGLKGKRAKTINCSISFDRAVKRFKEDSQL